MQTDHVKVLTALAEGTLPNGEMCICFAPLASQTGLERLSRETNG